MTDADGFLSVAEACVRLRVSDRTLQRLVSDGRIASYKRGKYRRFLDEDLDDYLGRITSSIPPAADRLTTRAVAARLGVSTRTVQRMLATGQLRGYRSADGRVYCSATELDWLSDHVWRRGPGTESTK